MQIALVGLPWSGKSTLFDTLAAYAGVDTRARPGHITPCVVPVPDPRFDRLVEIFHPRKQVRGTIEYIDVPGLDARGAAGERVPGTIVAAIKHAAALLEVIGGFDPVETASGDRVRAWHADAETLETELLIRDLAIVEKRLETLRKHQAKSAATSETERALLERCETALSDGTPLRRIELAPEEAVVLGGFQLLSQKPILRLINVAESDLATAADRVSAHWPGEPAGHPLVCSAALEAEIATLPGSERAEFLADAGIEEAVLPRLIAASQTLLGLITFFTVGEDEVRAWPIRLGTRAAAAAGEIHSDLERGFIRAETVSFDTLAGAGSLAACREQGTLRLEGKDYVVRDGDVITVRFSV